MAALLGSLSTIEDDARRADIEHIATTIDAYDAHDEWSALVQQRRACQQAIEIAHKDPEAVRLLAPLLARLLHRKVSREYRFSADAMIGSGLSAAIQTPCAQALARVTGASLIDRYRDSSRTIQSLTEPLAQTVIAGNTFDSKVASLEALAGLSWISPEFVVKLDDVTSLATQTAKLVAKQANGEESWDSQSPYYERRDIPGQARRESGLRLLLTLSIHVPERVSSIESFVDAIRSGCATNTIGLAIRSFKSQAYATCLNHELGTPADNPLEWVEPGTLPINTIESVVKESSRSATRRRLHAATALAAVAAIGGKFDRPIPPSLVEIISDERDVTRQFFSRSLGEAVAMSLQFETDTIQNLSKAVSQTISSSDRRYITCAIGALIKDDAERTANVSVPHEFDTIAWSRVRNMIQAPECIGEAALAADEYGSGGIPSLVEALIQSPSDTVRRRIACSLGALVIESSYERYSLPETVVEAATNAGMEARDAAEILGRYIAVMSTSHRRRYDLLVNSIFSVDGNRTRWATEVLGTVVLATEEAHADLPAPLSDVVHGQSIEDTQAEVIRAVGAVTATNCESTTPIPASLLDSMRADDTQRCEQATSALIIAVRTGYLDEIQSPREFIRGIEYDRGWSQLKLQVLGELVASGVTNNTQYEFSRTLANWSDFRSAAMQAIGAVAVAQVKYDINVPQELLTAVRATENSTEQRKAAEALERCIAAAVRNDTGFPEALVVGMTEAGTVSRRYAWALGELVLRKSDSALDVPAEIVEVAEAEGGPERRISAQFIGTVAAARTPYDALNNLAARAEIHNEHAREFPLAAASEAFEPEVFLQAITDLDEQQQTAEVNIAPYADFPEPERRYVFESVAIAVAQVDGTVEFPLLRQQCQYLLTHGTEISGANRMTVLNILVMSDESPIDSSTVS